jgi:hypothetical protein
MGFAEEVAGMDADVLACFGEDIRYCPKAGVPQNIKGIYDEAYARAELVGDAVVSSTGPAVVVLASDVSQPSTEGDTIERGGKLWHVSGVEPSGGLVVLRLSEDATV